MPPTADTGGIVVLVVVDVVGLPVVPRDGVLLGDEPWFVAFAPADDAHAEAATPSDPARRSVAHEEASRCRGDGIGGVCPTGARRRDRNPRPAIVAIRWAVHACKTRLVRNLPVAVAVVVLLAGVLHALWNAVAKAIPDRLITFGLIGVSTTLGAVVMVFVFGLPAGRAMPYVLVSAAIHVGYYLALMASYRLGAFNQTYPLARGSAPLLVALGAAVFAGEHLSTMALLGVATLTGGLVTLAFSAGHLGRDDLPAVLAALGTGVTIAAYTLVDGLGARAAHDPFAYTGLLFLLQGPAIAAIAVVRRGRAMWASGSNLRIGLAAGAVSLVAYGAVIWAQTRGPLAEVAALRETSVISAAIIGTIWLREEFGRRRIGAALLVAAGVVLLAA